MGVSWCISEYMSLATFQVQPEDTERADDLESQSVSHWPN